MRRVLRTASYLGNGADVAHDAISSSQSLE